MQAEFFKSESSRSFLKYRSTGLIYWTDPYSAAGHWPNWKSELYLEFIFFFKKKDTLGPIEKAFNIVFRPVPMGPALVLPALLNFE